MDIQELQRQRRRHLRWQARQRFWMNIWRTFALGALALALLWLTTLPQWVLHYPNQVVIRGHQYLAAEAILALVPLKPKQVLWQIYPQDIARSLTTRAPIQAVTIIRQLWPTQLVIEVQDRPPAAIMECNRCTIVELGPSPSLQVPTADQTWLLDAAGIAAPLSSYDSAKLQQRNHFPKYKIVGLLEPLSAQETPTAAALIASVGANTGVKIDASKQQIWRTMLQVLSQSPVKVKVIEWQANQDLILQTELGQVRLGPYSEQFSAQLTTLDQMRNLTEKLNPKTLDYIDLTDPKHPLVHQKPTAKP